eukprot:1878114-Rhodomonas_salina.2
MRWFPDSSIGVGPLHIRIDGWLVGVSHNRFGVGLHSKGDWDAPRQCKSGVMTAASVSPPAPLALTSRLDGPDLQC